MNGLHIWFCARSGRTSQREFMLPTAAVGTRCCEVAIASLELKCAGLVDPSVSASAHVSCHVRALRARFAGPSQLVGGAALVAQARRLRLGPPALGVPGLRVQRPALLRLPPKWACGSTCSTGCAGAAVAQQRARYRARVGGRGDTRRIGFETGSRAPAAHRARRVVRSLFFKEEMELSLIGLNAAGKTSLVNVIAVRRAPASGVFRPRRSSRHGAALRTSPRARARAQRTRLCLRMRRCG